MPLTCGVSLNNLKTAEEFPLPFVYIRYVKIVFRRCRVYIFDFSYIT